MKPGNKNSFNSLSTININDSKYKYYSLAEAEKNGLDDISKLPKSLKVLLENLLRYEDDLSVTKIQIEAIKNWLKEKKSKTEIAYRPARVLLQDYTGIPAVADLAAMREAVKDKNKDPNTINPLSAVDLVIDHSVQVDQSAKSDSFEKNVDIEFERNGERYSFLKWGQQAFNNFRIVPPGTGICHQVNLEYLSKVVWSEKFKDENYLFPDTLVGTDSHTTMVNGLSVLGWGVGGIEAEAAMLGQPISMLIPEVVGVEIKGKLLEGLTATDLVLAIVEMLRKKGVVGKFVEFYGEGLKNLTLADRATIANMAPELFFSMLLLVPFVDTMTTMLNEKLPLTPAEWELWGNPIKSKDYFDYILSYAPYNNLKKIAYPEMLITTSLFDNRVLYSEPVKYIAKLRDLKTDKNIQLLKCKMKAAGHGGMSGRDNAITELAEEYSFILKAAKIKE